MTKTKQIAFLNKRIGKCEHTMEHAKNLARHLVFNFFIFACDLVGECKQGKA
jgi:hypothetical protein